ncbi:hypothetical protein R76706_03121 [Ralstonia mannitolilytica]|nr:hypothetical protein R76706_03121 [Ralstonia mannitolilytica]
MEAKPCGDYTMRATLIAHWQHVSGGTHHDDFSGIHHCLGCAVPGRHRDCLPVMWRKLRTRRLLEAMHQAREHRDE